MSRTQVLWLLLGLSACSDKPSDDPTSGPDADADTDADADADADADDTGSPCDSDLGTIEGTVMQDFSWDDLDPVPAGGARVFAAQSIEELPIETIANTEGGFLFPLPAGTWSLTAETAESCVTTEATVVTLSACDTQALTLTVDDCFDGQDTGAVTDTGTP